jgi:hypothetical protein
VFAALKENGHKQDIEAGTAVSTKEKRNTGHTTKSRWTHLILSVNEEVLGLTLQGALLLLLLLLLLFPYRIS